MSNIFLYGTLRHLPLLEVVLGHAVTAQPARLPDHSVAWAKGQNFPILRYDPGAGAQGLLLEVSKDDRARLDFYEGPFGYRLHMMEVEAEAGRVTAEVYRPDPEMWEEGSKWSLEDWQRQWGSMVTRAAHEVMAAFGVQPAEEVARRFGMILSRAQAFESAASWERPRTVGSRIAAEEITITAQSYGYLGFFTVEDVSVRHPRLDGGPELHVDRAVFRPGEAVTVLPYDPVRDRVLLEEQFRVAPYLQGDPDPWLLEPPAGIRDAGESPETTARRECLEETGVALGDLHFVSRYYPTPGGTAQVLWSYVGIADLPDGLTGPGGLEHEGEDIAIHLVDFARAMDMVESGEIVVAPLIMSLQWLAMHRERLRA